MPDEFHQLKRHLQLQYRLSARWVGRVPGVHMRSGLYAVERLDDQIHVRVWQFCMLQRVFGLSDVELRYGCELVGVGSLVRDGLCVRSKRPGRRDQYCGGAMCGRYVSRDGQRPGGVRGVLNDEGGCDYGRQYVGQRRGEFGTDYRHANDVSARRWGCVADDDDEKPRRVEFGVYLDEACKRGCGVLPGKPAVFDLQSVYVRRELSDVHLRR